MSQFYELLANEAKTSPEQEALVEGDTRWTYAQFLDKVDEAARAFTAAHVAPGDRVGLMLYNQKEFLVCFFALRKIGAVVVPINIQMLPQDIGFVIRNAGLRTIIIADALYDHLKAYPLNLIVVGHPEGLEHRTYADFIEQGKSVESPPNYANAETDLAFLLYTSGTTGYPKGVMLTEKNVLANMNGFETILDFSKQDHIVLALPLFHAYGLIVALVALMNGAKTILIPKFHPKSILEALVQEQATVLPLVPTFFTVLLELIGRQGHEVKLPHLRYCVSGGASLPTELLKRVESILGAPIIEGYGLTETSPVISVNRPEEGSIPGSVGKPLPNVKVRIVHEDLTDCAVGEIGEILVQGDNVMSGYYQLPEETKATFTPDGWLRTGDLGHLDPEGHLFISGGRKKDLIIKAGENISPLTIEQILYQHPAVREVAVIGIPDAKLGEEIMACVSLKEGQHIAPQELMRFSRENLPAAYIPAQFEIMADLPKNPTGKIVKKLLRESFAQKAPAI